MRGATQRRLQVALDPSPLSEELLEALRALSAFDLPGSLVARHGLRSTVERHGLELDLKLLDHFRALQAELEAAERELDGLCEASSSAVARLQATRAATEVLISQTSRLKEQVRQAGQREKLALALADALHLSDEHEAVLNAPQGAALSLDELLEALARVRLVGSRGRSLLGGQLESLGLQVTSQMAAYEERGHTAIFRWVTAEAPRLPPNASAETLASLRRGVAALSGKPALLSVCLDEVAAVRREAHMRAFARSLSLPVSVARAGASSVADAASALERVLRDLAAAVGAEHQLLNTLFCLNPAESSATSQCDSLACLRVNDLAGSHGESTDADVSSVGPNEQAIKKALGSSFELIAPLLSSHVEALLRTVLPLPAALRLVLSLRYAAVAVAFDLPPDTTAADSGRVVSAPASATGSSGLLNPSDEIHGASNGAVEASGADIGSSGDGSILSSTGVDHPSSLSSTLATCASLASERFHASLLLQTDSKLRTAIRVPPDLSAPRQLFELTELLDELLETCSSIDTENYSATNRTTPAAITALGLPGVDGVSTATFTQREAESMIEVFIEPPLRHLASLVSPLATSNGSSQGAQSSSSGSLAATLSSIISGVGSPNDAFVAREAGTLRPTEGAVFLLNCVEAIRSVLSLHRAAAAAAAVTALDTHAQSLLITLVRSAASSFFDECGLTPKLDALRTAASQPQLTPASMIGLEPLAMTSAMRGFYSLLFQRGSGLSLIHI